MGSLPELLAKLGTIKNPVLFSSSFFSVSTMFFSRDFVMAPHPVSIATGAVMFLLATIVFLIAIWFYIYAFFKLPSSTQELLFLEEAKAAITRHKRSSTKPRTKKIQRNG
jgi:hypothetical protein